ncbi:DUF6264 family protein [Microbacterium luticocti]|uniref:DUF6264 family protein n=1 Tax=Microbacterium luticocti TaxID=451764 RepID=UPI000417BF2C|nr:DUF6264 family protein [Microbacterium luticocti]
MSTPDPRPRPQYGEYATPEQQRAHIREPAPSQPAPVPVDAARPPASARRPGNAARAAMPHPVDRIVTFALLAYGAVQVVLSAVSLSDVAALADSSYRMMGVPGSFTDTPAARAWGIAASVVLVVAYLLTAVLAVRAVRRGRIAWWIPVTGAVAAYIAVTFCVMMALMSDPALVHYILNPTPTPSGTAP